jgi:hypothetical protein
MATRAKVIKQIGDQFYVCYNHHDGYPSHLKEALNLFYSDEEKANELMKGGDWSFIDKLDGKVDYYNDDPVTKFNTLRDSMRVDMGVEYTYIYLYGHWYGIA